MSNFIKVLKDNKKVIENYFFMTLILVLNSGFALLIYPYLISSLGKETYGVYVFATSITNYFTCFVSFGFDLYGVRKIAENPFDSNKNSDVLSKIFSIKIYLELISIIVFFILLLCLPILQQNVWVYIVCFLMTMVNIFFPSWYFQGVQKMKVVSYIQLALKIISLPFIFIYVKQQSDLLLFCIIMTLSSLLGAFIAFYYIIKKDKVSIRFISFRRGYDYFKESSYFFYTHIANIGKAETSKVITGFFFGMSDLAIYDLAQKMVLIPSMLLANINNALFPKIMHNFNVGALKKILVIERVLGLIVFICMVLFGSWGVQMLGTEGMELSYPIAIILSITIFIFLQTGVYLDLVLLPKGFDKSVLTNQIIAFVSIILFIVIGLLVWKSIFVLPISLVLSGLMEIIYLRYKIRKEKLLN